MPLTPFPNGVSSFGVPLLGGNTVPTTTGKYLFVSSTAANRSDGNNGTSTQYPLATIDAAIGLCTANAGDTIIVMPGHTETITAAGGIACDVAGITIVGLGEGASRPTITLGTATTASVLITAASTKIQNIVFVSGIDLLVNPIHVQAASCTLGTGDLPIEWQDPSSALQAIRQVLTTAAATNLIVNLKTIGITSGGTAPVNSVRLVGVVGALINLDFYGRASTSVVEFVTTACANVEVYGYTYNSGTTSGAKDVVDTVTGSTWFGSIYDGSAGANFSGGSAAAWASDDTSTVAANQTVPTADSTANVLERDPIGNKTDASVYVPGATNSLVAYAKGTADLQARTVLSSTAVMVNGNTIFTVAGGPIAIEYLVSECVSANDGTASTVQYSATPTIGSAQTLSAASGSIATAAAGATITLAGTALSTAALYNASGPNLIANPGTVYVPAGTIKIVVGVGSTTGTWRHRLRYKPLAPGVTVT